MHIQSRAKPSRSDADLVPFLAILADRSRAGGEINVEGVTGSAVEHGGFFCFVVEHGKLRLAHERLRDERYRLQWTKDLYAEAIPPERRAGVVSDDVPNVPGVLAGIVARAKGSQLAAGRLLGVYLIGYGIGRFWIEGLRIDPSHEVAGLRWNQWVALAAIAAGAIYLFVTRGKKWDETPRAAIVDGVEGAIDEVDPVERSTEP